MTEHDDFTRAISAARPCDDLDDEVSLKAFLRSVGVDEPRVRIGEFEIERRVGRGGFGTVYLAIQPSLGRRVAIKLLHAHRLGALAPARLEREKTALSRLNHPNIVQIYQVQESPYGKLIAMEYVAGSSLAAWQRGRPWREILAAYLQAGEGLAAAHASKILHLDFKPSNVLVGEDGRVRVVDFGLAGGPGIASAPASDVPEPLGSVTEPGLVHTRPMGGTTGYASPEQVASRMVDPRSDQFSFCAALHEALFGRLPYTSQEVAAIATFPGHARPLARGAMDRPRWLWNALRRGLSPRVDDRWPSMAELLAVLRQVPWYRRNTTFAVFGGTAVAVPLVMANVLMSSDLCTDMRSELGGAWDEVRRGAVIEAIAHSDVPYRATAGSTVVRDLDRYSDAWLAASVASCEANALAGSVAYEEHLRHRSCLLRHRNRLDHLTAMLAAGDAPTIEHADELLAELAPPESCGVTGTAIEASSEAEDALLADLDHARLQLAAGHVAEAHDMTERVNAATTELGSTSVRAEALLVRGMVLDELGRDQEASAELREGAALAIEAGRDDIAAACWQRLTRISAHDLDRLEPAWEWNRLYAAAVRRLGSPVHLVADQLDAEGELSRLSGNPGVAEAAHRATLGHLARDRAPDDPRWITTWQLLAHARAEQGDLDEAAALYDRALQLAVGRGGAKHPQVAKLRLSRALIAVERGDYEGAEDDASAAEAILRASYGDDSPDLVVVLTKRAEIAMRLGRLDEATSVATRAWQLQRDHLAPGHKMRDSALTVLAEIELARRDWPRALELHEQLARERRGVGDADELARIDINIGWLLCRLDRCSEAREPYERVLAAGDDTQRAYAQSGLGQVELAAQRASAARSLLEAALRIATALRTPAPDLVAETEWLLAKARVDLGDPPREILPLVQHALEYYHATQSDDLASTELEALERSLRAAM